MEIRLILGDQLNEKHVWFTKRNDNVCYVMFEMRQETDYVKHHEHMFPQRMSKHLAVFIPSTVTCL